MLCIEGRIVSFLIIYFAFIPFFLHRNRIVKLKCLLRDRVFILVATSFVVYFS